MKKILFLSLLFFLFTIPAKAYNNVYLYDNANFLNINEKESISNMLEEFSSKHNMDMVIVIEDSYVYDMEEYADDFYDTNNFKKDGLLFLIDLSDLNNMGIYISTTGKAILYYDDERIDSLLDAVTSNLKNERYYDACDTFIDKVNYYYDSGIPDSNTNCTIENGNYVCKSPFPWLFIIIISLAVPTIVVIIFIKKNKMVKLASSADSYTKGKINITNREDKLTGTFTAVVPINIGNGSGRSGGSSVHSSGGISHGGGGRRI